MVQLLEVGTPAYNQLIETVRQITIDEVKKELTRDAWKNKPGVRLKTIDGIEHTNSKGACSILGIAEATLQQRRDSNSVKHIKESHKLIWYPVEQLMKLK